MRRTRFISVCLSFVACVTFLAARAQKDEEIARLGKVMGWKAGQVVADVGAGEGEFGFAAARVVGETGKVYLTELDEKKRKALEEEVKRREADQSSRQLLRWDYSEARLPSVHRAGRNGRESFALTETGRRAGGDRIPAEEGADGE